MKNVNDETSDIIREAQEAIEILKRFTHKLEWYADRLEEELEHRGDPNAKR